LTKFYGIEKMHMEFVEEQEKQKIIWVEMDGRNPISSMVIKSQPLYLDQYVAENLYMMKKAILFISDTITVNNSFDYISDKLGLKHFPVITKQFSTKRFLGDHIKIFAMDDIPSVLDISEDDYIEHVCNHVIAITESFQGKLLITFSSSDMLKKTYHLIKESGMLEEYMLLGQGISSGSNNRLVKQFNRFEKAILFITTSNLDGLEFDETLNMMIMVRLPFASPSEPIYEKRANLMTTKGKNAFYELSLPEAIIRFKKTFSQFLDLQSKNGKFIIFDKRIYASKYGQYFLQSLPKVPFEIVNLNTLCNEIEEDYNRFNREDF
jgi:ATP-dependent DNA helicase DinG